MLAVGSILHYATEGDVVWGTGVNGNYRRSEAYRFLGLDIRAVRGPLTKRFCEDVLQLSCPDVYGDPVLLLPRLISSVPQRQLSRRYVVVPHRTDAAFFPRDRDDVFPANSHHWSAILSAILSAELVISTSLHGLILAEAFGVPARMLRIGAYESLFKYEDYYHGTGREEFRFATSIAEALKLGGEAPPEIDLDRLERAFPHDAWSD